MITDISKYGQFYGGNSLVTSGQDICSEPRLYPNNAYYRFNKLRDEGDWPSNISGIYYGKGDCINCPKSHLKNFKDYSWKNGESDTKGDPRLEGATQSQTLQNHRITDINQFLMLNSKVGVADIRYKFLGPAFQRLIVGYQVFWPMQGYSNPINDFDTNYTNNNNGNRTMGFYASDICAKNPGVGEWTKEYDTNTDIVQPWAQMKRKIMGDYNSPSISQISKINMGAWYWPEKNNSFQWYINSNFNGPPKISGFNGLNKKFSELRIIFDSCSVSNIENRVRVQCPSPGSHIFAGKSMLATSNLHYRFHPDDYENQNIVGCFVEYFALIFTDKEKDTLNPIQLGVVEAKSDYNFYDVNNQSTFNDLLRQYRLNIEGGHNISGEANIDITGVGWPRGVNINLCSSDYYSSALNRYMGLFRCLAPEENSFSKVNCSAGDSIYSPAFDKFSGINIASGLEQPWSERRGLWTSGHYLDPPFYNGGFLKMADAKYMGVQSYFLGNVKQRNAVFGYDYPYNPHFYRNNDNIDDGASFYQLPRMSQWFCKYMPSTTPDGYYVLNRGYIESKWIYLNNIETSILGNKLIIPHRPLYFIHGFASALLTPFDSEAPGGGFYCGEKSYPFLNKLNECNSVPGSDYWENSSAYYLFLVNGPSDFAHWGMISVAGYLEEPVLSA